MKGKTLYPDNMDMQIRRAIERFWNTRLDQLKRQLSSGGHDQGNRSAVTGGKQLDGFVEIIKGLLVKNGIDESNIFCNSNLELPGYFRPNKQWDLLVVKDSQLVIAMEFKSQVGPSFGNNFNNRTEEAMGSAIDIWTAYREGAFGAQPQPWLGYLMVLEDCARSSTPVSARSPHFSVFPEFIGASYKKRYEIFCNKLMLERHYASTCFITTANNPHEVGNYNMPAENLSFQRYVCSMLGAVVAHGGRNV